MEETGEAKGRGMHGNMGIMKLQITSYEEAEGFLYELPRFTTKNSLSHTRGLLNRMGDPGEGIPRIHVAGTNGKGSVCNYLQNLLGEYGYKTGGFISPHLVTMHERFLIDRKPVGNKLFMESFFYVKNTADIAFSQGISYPTFFEFLFLMGMYIFEKEEVGILILETGLGGRLDATNVFQRTDVCVITRMGLDHCRYLGNTIGKIAREKAGIIKKDASVIFLEQDPSVEKAIVEKGTKEGAFLIPLKEGEYSVEKIKHKSIDFSYKSRYYNYINLIAPTAALYQAENAALALRAFEVFLERKQLTEMSVERLKKAVAGSFWEGRMEEVLPGVYFDGAHNEEGIRVFLESVEAMEVKGRRILCFSAVKDKAYGRMASMLYESGLFEQAVAVEMEDEKGVPLEVLKECFSQYRSWKVTYVKGAREGLLSCITEKGPGDRVFIAGSLYLVGLIKSVLRRERYD